MERFVACVEDEKKLPVPRSVVVGVLVLNVFFTVLQVFWCGLLLKETKKMFIGGGEEDEKSEDDDKKKKVNSCSYLIKITHV